MLISHKHKFITIDIPKTGTRSLRQSLIPLKVINICGEPNLNAEFYQHDNAIRVRKQFKKNNWNWNDYFKFTIVRNPWARYFSFFKYFKSYGEKYLCLDESINWGKPEINQGKHCAELFKNRDDHAVLRKIILNNNSQDSYYSDDKGRVIVNHVASFENLEDEFVFLCNQVGMSSPGLQHGNKSSSLLKMTDIYDQELIDLVAKKESRVIELKGYTI
tara:strand:+ start:26824 stop:27474 length:651 start_codon:yes stop_codon:yes gene_type:complete